LNPGTMKASGRTSIGRSTRHRSGPGRGLRADIDPREVGEPERPVLPMVWQVQQSPLPSMISRPTLTMSAVVRSAPTASPREAALPSAAPSGRHSV
jgi:hypothetical protein